MFDQLVTAAGGAFDAPAVWAWARVEAAACARRLTAMVDMLDRCYAADGSADREQWYLDNWGSVCAEIGAAQQVTPGVASHQLMVATALRDRLPRIGALFADGLIDYRLVTTIVWRTALIKDPAALRAVDTSLSCTLRNREPMSHDQTLTLIDALVDRHDPHAVRRTQDRARSRGVEVTTTDADGLATLWATLFAHDAEAFDARLDALAATVCNGDPRTKDQRRSDAMGALATGADRLACGCQTPDCPAAANPPASSVVIHVVANHDTITTTDPNPTPIPDDGGRAGDSGSDGEPAASPADARAGSAAAQHDSLDGQSPPKFSKPLREMTLAEVIRESNADPGEPVATAPGVIIGGGLLPGPVLARAARNATIVAIIHPGNAPPEPRYTPSKALADFVRSRDLTCRFPGCKVPATECDVDHTIAYPHGPTCASNLKCLCRFHHLLKTFWTGPGGWRDRQLPDGTVIWTAPGGQSYTTHPGSRLLFPTLCEPTAPVTATEVPTAHTAGLTMPRRKTTRTQARQQRIDDERRLNQLDPPTEWARRREPPPF